MRDRNIEFSSYSQESQTTLLVPVSDYGVTNLERTEIADATSGATTALKTQNGLEEMQVNGRFSMTHSEAACFPHRFPMQHLTPESSPDGSSLWAILAPCNCCTGASRERVRI